MGTAPRRRPRPRRLRRGAAMSLAYQPGQGVATTGGVSGHQPTNLGDILERVLDRGLVIVGDIRISLLDIELLTIKLRLLIASVDTARQLGIDWWEHDPTLSSRARSDSLAEENDRLRQRLRELEVPVSPAAAGPAHADGWPAADHRAP